MKRIVLSAVGLLLASVPVVGHHAFGGEFDPNKPVLLKGKITKIEWVNPHAWIHLEIPKADGNISCEFTPGSKCEEWMVEGGTPNSLRRRGWGKDSLKAGDVVTVEGYMAKNGSNHVNGRTVTLPDGKRLFGGSADDGGPGGQ